MEIYQLKNSTPVFWKRFSFFRKFVSKLKYWNRAKFPVIVALKHVHLTNEGLFWKSLVPFALYVTLKMKPVWKKRTFFQATTSSKLKIWILSSSYVNLKRAPRFNFMHYSCIFIILLNSDLHKSVYTTCLKTSFSSFCVFCLSYFEFDVILISVL